MNVWFSRLALSLFAAGFLGTANPASAQNKAEVTLTAASYAPAKQVGHRSIEEFLQNIEKASGGRIAYAFHPNGSLISQAQMLQAGRLGTADVVSITTSVFPGEFPFSASAGTLMFLWDLGNFDKAYAVLKPHLEAELAAQNLKPLWLAGTVTQWFLQSKTDLDNPDWAGRRIRGFGGSSTRMIEILGGTNVSIANNELAMAASTGVIQGIGTSLGSFSSFGVEKQLPCMLVNNNVPLINVIAINADTWNRLPEDMKVLMNAEAEKIQKKYEQVLREEEEPAQAKFESITGCVQRLSDTQRDHWRQLLDGIFKDFEGKQGAKGAEFVASVLDALKE